MAKQPSGANGDGSVRRDPKANKSLAIRMVLEAHPGIAPKDAVPLVKKKYGHAIDAKLVSIVKSKIGSRQVAERAKATPRGGSAAVDLDALQAGVVFVRQAGGFVQARDLLSILEGLKTAL
jgi:hypothetical protein